MPAAPPRTIVLTQEPESSVRAQVARAQGARGHNASAGEVVRAALRLPVERDHGVTREAAAPKSVDGR
jgi:Arc/MetJ-type ribon-helix-helix transcriptional regulator